MTGGATHRSLTSSTEATSFLAASVDDRSQYGW